MVHLMFEICKMEKKRKKRKKLNYKGKKKEEKKKKRSNKNLPFILFGNKDIITLDLDECTGNEIEIDVVFGKGRNSDFCNNDVDTEV